MTYTIVHETKKAYKIQADDGFEFWIQKRWWKAGELTPAGHRSEQTARAENQEDNRIDVEHDCDWQNDKWIAIDYCATFTLSSSIQRTHAPDKRIRVFIPRAFLTDGKIRFYKLIKFIRRALDNANLPSGYTIMGRWNEHSDIGISLWVTQSN